MNRLIWKLPMWVHSALYSLTGWVLVAHLDEIPASVEIAGWARELDQYINRLEWKRNFTGDA